MRSRHAVGLLALVAAMSGCAGRGSDGRQGPPLPESRYLAKAHAHNDYERGRPLLDAVDRGFASVEVDVFLVENDLYVAHDVEDVDPSATLTELYLDPLRELARRNGGRIHAESGATLQLIIDVKTPADETYHALARALSPFSDLLTTWTRGAVTPGAVTVVISGNRAIRPILQDTLRYVALDGRVEDDRTGVSADVMPLVSIDWTLLDGSAPGGRLAQARELVTMLHGEGRKVRFWGTPDREDLWMSLTSIGVDYIGTDDNRRLQRFLQRR